MSQSEIEKVSEALRDELGMGSFTKEFTPVESYDATMQLEGADRLQVDVVPVRSEPEQNTDGSLAWGNVLDIGIRFRFTSEHQDAGTGDVRNRHIHGMLAFEQEIVEFLFAKTRRRLQAYNQAILVNLEVRVAWVPKHLREWQQFTGIIRVTYRTETEIE